MGSLNQATMKLPQVAPPFEMGKTVFADELPGSRKPGQTGIYRNIMFQDNPVKVSDDPEYPTTSYECFEWGLRRSPNGPCLGHRPWDAVAGDYKKEFFYETYQQVSKRRTDLGSGIVHLANGAPWVLGMWSLNRPEWQIVSQAAAAYSLMYVSLYETLGHDIVEYCINHSEINAVFAAPTHIPELLSLAAKCPSLKVVVSMESFDFIDTKGGGPAMCPLPKSDVLQAWGKEKGIQVLDFKAVEALGQQHPQRHRPPTPDSISSICYTSGTTDKPKGAILSHRLLASTSLSNQFNTVPLGQDDIVLSFLPLSHIFARFTEDASFFSGAAIAFALGDPLRLVEDLQLAKPTVMIAVPRLLNRFYSLIRSQTVDAPGMKGALARRAFDAKLSNYKTNGAVTHAFYDRLIMNKIKKAVGSRLRLIGLGAAPCSPKVLEFLTVAFSCRIQEGYGQTETGGTTTKNVIGDSSSSGLVGPPQVPVEIKLVDVPELGYFSTDKPDARGEMYVRGETLFSGYYKDEAKTRESFTEDGWFKTGDVASVDRLGRFKIIDRVKNLIKLAQGEYVAVEKVESVYSTVPLGAQTYVYADPLHSHLILFVVPDVAQFINLAKSATGKTIEPNDLKGLQEASQDPRVIKAALKLYTQEARSRKLQGFETVKQLAFKLKPFSVEDDTLTPTLKVKRNMADKLLKQQADQLFAEYENTGGRSKL